MEGAAQQSFNVDAEEPAAEPVRSNRSAEAFFRKPWALIIMATALLLMVVFAFGFDDKTQEKHETNHVAHAFIASPGINIAARPRGQNTAIAQKGSRQGNQPFLSMVRETGADDKEMPTSTDLSRRDFVGGALLAGTALGALPAVAADPVAEPLLSDAAAAAYSRGDAVTKDFLEEGYKMFEGRYTDPINHPGGYREILLKPTEFAGYQLAEVKGGGGRGEPEKYTLPAVVGTVDGRQRITIDFSPKGGPRDFPAVMETKDGKPGLRFLKDNNFWPKVA